MTTLTTDDIFFAATTEDGGPLYVQLVETIAEFHRAAKVQQMDPHRCHGLDDMQREKVFPALTDFMNVVLKIAAIRSRRPD